MPKASGLCLYREKELLRNNMNDVAYKVVEVMTFQRSIHFLEVIFCDKPQRILFYFLDIIKSFVF